MKSLAFIATIAAGLAVPAAAHHSFGMYFDRDATATLTGTVTQFSFGDPHAFIKLAVVQPDGTTREWHVETTQPLTLARKGWKADSIKPGQRLIVDGWPARDGRPYMRFRTLAGADGRQLALWMPNGPAPAPTAVNTPG